MLESLLRSTPLLLTAALVLAACEDQDDDSDTGADDSEPITCVDDERAEDFMVDMAKTGERHTVTIVDAMPAMPGRGDNTWTIRLADAAGTPEEGATIDLKPWMPDHGHGSPVEEVVTDLGAGEYEITSLNLFMPGLWQITFDLTDAGAAAGDAPDEVMISICIE